MRFFCVSSSSSTLFYFSCHCLPISSHPAPCFISFENNNPFSFSSSSSFICILDVFVCLFAPSLSLLYYCILSIAPFVSCAGAARWARQDMNKSIAAADIAPVSSRSGRDSSRCTGEKSLPLIRVQYQKCSTQKPTKVIKINER